MTASMSWELDREHEEFRASVRAFVDRQVRRWLVGPEDGDVYWVAADVGWLTFPIQAVVGGLASGMTVACFEGAMDTRSNARFYEICEKV